MENQWMRISHDFVTVYDVTGKPIGKLPKTYGIRILEIGDEFVKVFSPDMNRNVFLRKTDLELPDGSEE